MSRSKIAYVRCVLEVRLIGVGSSIRLKPFSASYNQATHHSAPTNFSLSSRLISSQDTPPARPSPRLAHTPQRLARTAFAHTPSHSHISNSKRHLLTSLSQRALSHSLDTLCIQLDSLHPLSHANSFTLTLFNRHSLSRPRTLALVQSPRQSSLSPALFLPSTR